MTITRHIYDLSVGIMINGKKVGTEMKINVTLVYAKFIILNYIYLS